MRSCSARSPRTTTPRRFSCVRWTRIPSRAAAYGHWRVTIKAADQLLDEARRCSRGGSKSQILLLLTDGEDHDEGALPAARALAEKGVSIYTVGIGSTAGEPIPLVDDKGRFTGYLKDRQGGTVLTRLNEDILKQIADAGHGRYVSSQGGGAGIDQIMPDLASFEREEREAKLKVVYADRFQWALVPALVFFLFAAFVPRRRKVALLAFAGLRFAAAPADAFPLLSAKNGDVEAGNKLLDANKADDALKSYEAAKGELGDRPELFVDQGMALAKKGDHKGAKPMFERALMSADAKLRGRAHYLMGNGVLFDEKDYQGAIAEYKKALAREDASNQNAKYNLELAQKLLKQEQEKQKNEKKDDPKRQDQEQRSAEARSEKAGRTETRPKQRFSKRTTNRSPIRTKTNRSQTSSKTNNRRNRPSRKRKATSDAAAKAAARRLRKPRKSRYASTFSRIRSNVRLSRWRKIGETAGWHPFLALSCHSRLLPRAR